MRLRRRKSDSILQTTTQYVDRLADRDALVDFAERKFIELSYEESQFLVGFQFDVGGGTAVDLANLESFLRKLGLPDEVTVDLEGAVDLAGMLSLDFAIGIDLSSLEDGVSFDEIFLEVNDMTFSGTIDTADISASLGYGPLLASVTGGMLQLSAAVNIGLDPEFGHRITLAQLRDEGLSTLDFSVVDSSLYADLPLALSVAGITEASTELVIQTDDLFGDIDDFFASLPTLDDIANLSMGQIIEAIKSAVNFVEQQALSHPETVARIPLLNNYLDLALKETKAALAFVESLETAQTTQLWHNAASGKVTLQLEGDSETFDLDLDAGTVTAETLQDKIAALTSIATSETNLVVEVDGAGTESNPWKLRFFNNLQQFWHDGLTGTVELQFAGDDTRNRRISDTADRFSIISQPLARAAGIARTADGILDTHKRRQDRNRQRRPTEAGHSFSEEAERHSRQHQEDLAGVHRGHERGEPGTATARAWHVSPS